MTHTVSSSWNRRTATLSMIIIVLASLCVYQYYILRQARSALSDYQEVNLVTGIVLNLRCVEYELEGGASYIGLLRLTSEDSVNRLEIGEISEYRMRLDSYVELDVGNLLISMPEAGDPPMIHVQSIARAGLSQYS